MAEATPDSSILRRQFSLVHDRVERAPANPEQIVLLDLSAKALRILDRLDLLEETLREWREAALSEDPPELVSLIDRTNLLLGDSESPDSEPTAQDQSWA